MKKLITLLFVLSISSFSLFAQDTPAKTKNPYKIGEQLGYEGKYKFLGLSLTIADLDFRVSSGELPNTYKIDTVGNSRGSLVNLFNFSFTQIYHSTVSSENYEILKTAKYDKQNDRLRESVADFNYDKMEVSWTETDPKYPARAPRRVASSITNGMQDLVSAVYCVRQMPFALGKTFVVKVSDSGLVYEIPVKVMKREQIDSLMGKKWSWKIEPEIFGKGRFIEQKGSLEIWITDDANRIPIRAKLDTKIGGGIEIRLTKLNGKSGNAVGK